ncbi:MAG: hypothetical protein QF902_02440 [Rhodospirillales bacterium]|nr:hypothetical protein [Rhodospirillales bacterium]
MADAGRLDLDHHLAGLGTFQLNRLDLQWFGRLEGHRSFYVHVILPRS